MANRKTRRKEKNYNSKKVVISTPDESMTSLVRIGVVVVIIFVAFYILTFSLTGNSKNNDTTNNNDTNTPVNIQYDEILAGETFKMNNNEYYVLFYDFSDRSTNILYNGIVSTFKTNHTGSKIYTVDLSKGFTTSYIAENSNPSVQQIDDLKVNGPTVIKISNGKNTTYVEGKVAIINALK